MYIYNVVHIIMKTQTLATNISGKNYAIQWIYLTNISCNSKDWCKTIVT